MGLVIEPQGSQWRDPESGVFFGTGRADGGPTSWHADILTSNQADSYREFLLNFQDYQLAFDANNNPVNPPFRVQAGCRSSSSRRRSVRAPTPLRRARKRSPPTTWGR